MRWILSLILLSAVVYGVVYWKRDPLQVKQRIGECFEDKRFHTLEAHYSANQIMATHRHRFLKDSRYHYLEPRLEFYPYILLEVKYSISSSKTREGMILWDLTDGEMVLNTSAWEKTHGFGDCIQARAQPQEFKILNLLAQRGGAIDRENLIKALRVDNETLDQWIDSCRRKKLIVQTGNRYRLHLQNPKLHTLPETKLDERLVTQLQGGASCIPKRYALDQVEQIAKAAFGGDFTIRKASDLYLPVYAISVQNPDGSVHTTRWNALNGKPIYQARP